MAKYAKRADGRYCTTITLPLDGEKKKKTIYGKTIREIDDKIAELRAQANKGIVVDDRGITVEEFTNTWFTLYKKNSSLNTQEMYKRVIDNYIIPVLGPVQLSLLKKHMLQGLLNDIVSKGFARTADIARITLKQIIASAIDENYIYIDIARDLKLPKKQKTEKKPLTGPQIELIHSLELPPKEKTFIFVLLYTGIRRGEALALTWNDIDFAKKTITINKTVVFSDNAAIIKNSPKTASGNRTIPIPSTLFDVLKQYKDTQESNIVFPMDKKNDYMTKSSFNKFWRSLKKQTELDDDITPHILRHTYATKLYYAGVDVKQAQYLLGHSSISVTLGIYTHLQNAECEKNISKLDTLYS